MLLTKTSEDRYDGDDHTVLQREWGVSAHGNPYNGCWVLRRRGDYVDHDRYRNDLAERQDLELPS